MGITGLLPFLEKSSKRMNICEFSGSTVAIDSYCWLHKGVFSCADKIAKGLPTDAYVRYCMKFLDMLLANNIKPILVFDGRHLPAKAQTEAKRRENRHTNRCKATELLKMGQDTEARNLLRRSIDVTHEMALNLIKHCQNINIDCIVAPYEADAQLAYLNVSGIADVVITEDSDLTLFGCKKVFFKMDHTGNGLLVDNEKLHLAMGIPAEHFDMEKFRYMCILSGCDYLASLPGIGLQKAKKFINLNTDCDIHRALTRLGSYLNMKSLVVTKEYRDAFILALITFKHQLVFCPLQRKQVRLYPPPADVTLEQLKYAGEEEKDPQTALHLAYGNCDPFSFEMLHDFDPDKIQNRNTRSNSWGKKPKSQQISIWSKDYKLKKDHAELPDKKSISLPDNAGKNMILQTIRVKREILIKKSENAENEVLNPKEMLTMYARNTAEKIKTDMLVECPKSEEKKVSPVLSRRNPFSKQPNKVSPSLLKTNRSRLRKRNLMLRRTIIDETVVTESKFFSRLTEEKETDIEMTEDVQLDAGTSSSSGVSSQSSENQEGESENLNIKRLSVTDEMDVDLHQMDVDQDQNESFQSCVSDVCAETLTTGRRGCSDSSNFEVNNSSSYRGNNLFAEQKPNNKKNYSEDDDLDGLEYAASTHLQTNLFNQSSARLNQQKTTTIKQTNRKSSNSRAFSDSKLSGHNQSRKTKQTISTDNRQQSLLNMFGFQKKSNLKC